MRFHTKKLVETSGSLRSASVDNPAGIYLLKVNNRETRKRY